MRDYFVNAQTIVVIVAVLAWAWLTFFHDKVFADTPPPRADIAHDIFSTCLDENQRLVRVKVEVRNIGTVPVAWTENIHSVAQVAPMPQGQSVERLDRDVGASGSRPGLIVWPESFASPSRAGGISVGPNKRHAQYHDFVIEPAVRVIEVRSTFVDAAGKQGDREGWHGSMKTIYDVGSPSCR